MIKTIAEFISEAKKRKIDLQGLENDLDMFDQNIQLEKSKWEIEKEKLNTQIEKLKEDKLINVNNDLSIRISEISSLKKYNNNKFTIIMKDGKRTYSSGLLPGLIPVKEEDFKRLQEVIGK